VQLRERGRRWLPVQARILAERQPAGRRHPSVGRSFSYVGSPAGPSSESESTPPWRKTDTRIGLLEFSSAAACAIPSPSAPSAGISYATWHLKHGRYMIYCSMPGHFQKGMHAHITVT
jgi:hypothetical protein